MSCNCNCNMCPNLVTVSTITIVGTNLVLNIPQRSFNNCQYACFIITQAIPSAATIDMPVVVTIGTSTTEYALITCEGVPVTASMLDSRGRFRLKTQVATTSTTGVFRVLRGLCNTHSAVLSSIPVPAAPAAGGTT